MEDPQPKPPPALLLPNTPAPPASPPTSPPTTPIHHEDIESQFPSQPHEELAHQTAQILCTLSTAPRVHPNHSSTSSALEEDAMAFLSSALQYTVHPVTPLPAPPQTIYPPTGGKLMQYETADPSKKMYPDISVSEEEWTALVSTEYVPSPIVEEFLRGVMPIDGTVEDRQGWYEFLCEDGASGGEEWSRFLSGDVEVDGSGEMW